MCLEQTYQQEEINATRRAWARITAKAPQSTDAPLSGDQNTCLTTKYSKVSQTLSATSRSVSRTCYVATRTHYSKFGSAPMDVNAESLKLPTSCMGSPGLDALAGGGLP